MPLDGTRYDEATQQLIDAKELLLDKGWCTGQRENWLGEHCALGVLDVVIGEMAAPKHAAVRRLADAIPWEPSSLLGEDWRVAVYNNAQGSIDPILEWFDRAIAGETAPQPGCVPAYAG